MESGVTVRRSGGDWRELVRIKESKNPEVHFIKKNSLLGITPDMRYILFLSEQKETVVERSTESALEYQTIKFLSSRKIKEIQEF